MKYIRNYFLIHLIIKYNNFPRLFECDNFLSLQREIIVVHNLKEVESGEILEHLWETQVTQIYGSGSVQRTKVAAINPINSKEI